MSQYQTLKTQIQENIKQNGEGAIRGDILQTQLLDMINALGAGYQFMGVATPTNPGTAQTPDYKCFYLATTPGTYTNLGGLVVADGEVALLKYDSSWHKDVTGIATADGLGNLNLLTGLELKESPKDLAVGSIYNGVVGDSKDCLYDNNYIKVLPNLFLGIVKATDILVRITQYDENKTYITQGGEYYSDITSVITQQNTKFIRISASYENRGFSNENPITIDAYQEGDFGILIPQSDKIDDEPTAGSQNLVKSGGVENFTNSRLHIALTSNQLPNIDTQAGTLDLGPDPNFYVGNSVYNASDFESESDYRAIPLQSVGSGYSSRRKLVFNIETIKFRTLDFNIKQSQSEVLVGSFVTRYSESGYVPGSFVSANLPFEYTINGLLFSKEQTLELRALSDKYVISSSADGTTVFANFDTTAGTLTFPTDSWVCINCKDGFRFSLPTTPVSYMVGETSIVFLMYDYSTDTLAFKVSNADISNTEMLLAIVRKRYSTTDKEIVEVNACFNYTIDGVPFNKKQKQYLDEITRGTSTQYIGERLPINNSYIKTLFTLSNFGSATYPVDSQGMDVYDNKYLFQGNQSGEDRSVYILDLVQKTILGNFLFTESGSWHMNNINCAIKEIDTDKFPLIYLSECYGTHRCAVVKISDSADSYIVKQLITFNTSSHYGGGSYAFDWFLDIENNLIYCYGNTASSGSVEIVKFNLPSLSDATVTLTDNDVLDSFIVNGIGIYQGSKLINGKLVCPEGFGNAEYPAYISVIDLTKKQVVTRVPWGYGEPEAAAVYENGILIVNNSTNPIYRLLTI